MENPKLGIPGASSTYESPDSGVAWAAIIGGALAAAGLALILSPFGASLGLASGSPWKHDEYGHAFTITSAIWLIIVQWLSSGFGGYIAGRLRTKWEGAHTHEVFFRDTVNGFLAWALASILGALLLLSALSHVVAKPGLQNDPSSYMTDRLFRSNNAATNVTDHDRVESRDIIALGAIDGQIPETDKNYLTELIVSRTGISVIEASTRIDSAVESERAAARNAAKASIFLCLSLAVGAFIAAAAGALGGIHRDIHYIHGKLRI